MLFGHAEKVALVIGFERTTWLHPQETIVKPIVHIGNKASQDQRSGLVSHLLHPLKRAHIHVLGKLSGFHAKASGKHFWKHYHIGGLTDLPYFFLKHGQIGSNVLPMKI